MADLCTSNGRFRGLTVGSGLLHHIVDLVAHIIWEGGGMVTPTLKVN